MGENLSTTQLPYRILRDTVTQAGGVDTDLADATKKWSTFVSTYHPDSGSSAIAIRLRDYENAVDVIFDHKNANTDTATFIIYAYRQGGPAEYVCSSTLTAGAQANSDSTARYYADTVGTITQRWISTVHKWDAAGNDGVAKVSFDAHGRKYLLCLFTAISSGDEVRAKIAGH